MKNTNDISYFTIRLLELLTESYPELAKDKEFVDARSNAALEVYNEAIIQGNNHLEANHLEANHLANEVLFSNLPFSKMDFVFGVVCNEFYRDVQDDKLRSFAIKMLSICEPVFKNYNLATIEDDHREYQRLYTELTGVIQLELDKQLALH